jgi:hypothetical protein
MRRRRRTCPNALIEYNTGVHIGIRASTYTRARIRFWIYAHACARASIDTCAQATTGTSASTQASASASAYTSTSTSTSTCAQASTCTCTCTCTSTDCSEPSLCRDHRFRLQRRHTISAVQNDPESLAGCETRHHCARSCG